MVFVLPLIFYAIDIATHKNAGNESKNEDYGMTSKPAFRIQLQANTEQMIKRLCRHYEDMSGEV